MKRLKKLLAAFIAATVIVTASGCAGNTESLTSSVTSDGSSLSAGTSSAAEGSEPEDTVSSPQEESTSSESGTTAAPQEESTSSESSEESSAESEPPASAPAESVTENTTKPAESTSAPQEQQPQQASGITVEYSAPNSWEEGGMKCTQLEFKVKNNSGSGIGGWTAVIDFGQNVEVMQSWNAEVTGGAQLTAKNAEYNGEIANGGESSFGCIIKTSNDAKPKTVSVNGSGASVSGGTGGNNSDSGQGGNGGSTASQPAQPSEPPSSSDIEVTGRYGLVSDCGQLSVRGADLVDKNGTPVQLRGISTHGIQWFPAFANKDVFRYLRDEWNINVIRLAMYSGAGEGYTDSTKAGIEKTVQDAVDACIELDMYVIVDWHVLQDQSPQVRKADALRFFGYMSEKYADYPNVIYEICNEPNGYATWSGDIKPYAEEVIPVIRKNDPDSVVIVGTPTWSQDIDKALADPLDYDNVMYALHYYAATHTDWLRDRLKNCYSKGLPIIVSEFGNCDASGNGSNDWGQAKKWLELLDSLNISYMNWSLCDKAEAASLLKPGASSRGGWSDSDLSENGKFMRDWFKNHL